MALGTNYAQQDCSLARALEMVGERWSMLIVRDAFYGVRRFNDFLAHLDIPRAVLTSRLAALVKDGVLTKEPYREAPVRYAYLLTDAGRELWHPIYALAQWGERHASQGGPRTIFSHVACGTRLDPLGGCPSCGGLVSPENISIQPGPGADLRLRTDPVSRALSRPHRLLTPVVPASDPLRSTD